MEEIKQIANSTKNDQKNMPRGEICQICNRKFLYRDAMYELMGKLQIRDLTKKQLEKELEREEYVYDQIVSNLSKAKQERRHHNKSNMNEKKVKQRAVDEFDYALQQARAEKEHEVGKLNDLDNEITELDEEEKALMKEIKEFETVIARDTEMIGSLDQEIEKLDKEATEKLQKLRTEQRF